MGRPKEYHFLYKLVLVGNSCVGKSSLVIRYADDEFSEVFLATIGVDFRFKSFLVGESKVKLQIWDTAGHDRFKAITSSYYRGTHAVMIVFDLTDQQSFRDAVGYWFNEVKNTCPITVKVMLIGNKSDFDSKRVVPQADLQQFLAANSTRVIYIETSAKTNHNVEKAFTTLAEQLLSEEATLKKTEEVITQASTVLSEPQRRQPRKFYCCQGI